METLEAIWVFVRDSFTNFAMPFLSILGGLSGFYAYVASGSRVKVEAYFAIHNGNAMLRVTNKDLNEFPFGYLTSSSQPSLVIRARNTGRSPISVEVVEIANTKNHSLPFMDKPSKGKSLPTSLLPGTSEYWVFDLVDPLAVSEYVQTGGRGLPVRAIVSLANNKKPKSPWLSHKKLLEHKEFWFSVQQKFLQAHEGGSPARDYPNHE
jgi:hypothetical protein